MKELTIKEKAKRYDEVVERAKSKIKNDKDHVLYENDVIDIFPELEESEDADEKIRKALIKLVTNHASMDLFIEYDIHLDEALSWLEKQGENSKPLYIRFGDIPTDEKSKIYNGETEIGTERGVSVYPAFEDSNGNIVLGLSLPITKTSLYTQQHLLEYDNRPCYLVSGDYVGKGTDGEPLLRNVKIVREIKDFRIKQSKQKTTCTLNNSASNVKFPFEAKVKSNGKVVTIHGGQLSIDCKEWIKYQSDKKDGYMVYEPEDLELVCNIEQNHTDNVEPKFKVKYGGSGEYNVLDVKDICGVTYYGIEDEPNHIDYVLPDNCEIISEQKPADNDDEPKFHEGDLIIHQGTENIYQVVARIDNQYQLKYGDNYTIQKCADVDRCARLWDITKDAKDGDVLYMDNGLSTCTFIYKSIGNVIIQKYASYNKFGFEGTTHLILNDGYVCPATKEQRDLLFQKIKENGYEWDAEKKELKKVEQKPIKVEPKFKVGQTIKKEGFNSGFTIVKIKGNFYYNDVGDNFPFTDQDNWELVEKNSVWSEEDETILKRIIINIENLQFSEEMREKYCHIPNTSKNYYQIMVDWLKSLKDRVQPKVEWSEDDKKMYLKAIKYIQQSYYSEKAVVDWLKSLKERINPQPKQTWKPSEEQLHYLYWIANIKLGDSVVEQDVSKHLNELYEQLKQL